MRQLVRANFILERTECEGDKVCVVAQIEGGRDYKRGLHFLGAAESLSMACWGRCRVPLGP